MQTIRDTLDTYLQAWNARDIARIVPFYSPTYEGLDVGQSVPIAGRAGAERVIRAVLHGFPDLELCAEEPLIQGERVSLAWNLRGTHLGTVMNIPPTRRPVEVRGISILTIQQGLITRASHVWDVAGLLRALGLLPDLP